MIDIDYEEAFRQVGSLVLGTLIGFAFLFPTIGVIWLLTYQLDGPDVAGDFSDISLYGVLILSFLLNLLIFIVERIVNILREIINYKQVAG